MTASFYWRGMLHADVPAVAALAAEVYPSQLWEDIDALAARRQIGTGLVLVAPPGARVYGYLLAHPWDLSAPPLTAELDAPPQPETLWLHDLALVPEARGRGLADVAIRRFLAWAALFRSGSLVALDPVAARFWGRRGFRPVLDCSATYVPGAVLMRRPS
ncbi:GCN5-related N-acetyltransferase [Methylobacterium sp. 4-46]|uniref:GNAT family N-acetyltransferase n=1 Tax=unclassified Methylobacterium TaxID=2615210 RepID=UPI000165C922|nr:MULTISPECIES: GNAT family N-acetyltransferase [Methylobacterium]ACA18514.1 GCN5-related N-acetyltransferase [Methylobacterium sp. 4-46]WFT77800.1 GNAT family N-acetyltransferase [Methylobacterium nodulans]